MKRLATIAFAGLLAACSRETLPLSMQVASLTPQELTIQVTTRPGARVAKEYGELAAGPVADAQGIAKLVVPRGQWAHYSGSSLNVYAESSTFLKGGFGHGDLQLPIATAKLARIPDNEPLYFTYLDGEEGKGTAEKSVRITDPQDAPGPGAAGKKLPALIYWSPPGESFALHFAAPAGSKVDIGGTSTDVVNGLARAEIPSETLTLAVEMASLSAKQQTLSIPVTVAKDGQTRSHLLSLAAASWHNKAWWLAARLDGVASGKGLPEGSTVDALLIRTPDSEVQHLGAPGRAAQARWVAIEGALPRNEDSRGHPCPLHRYEDLDVSVLDAHTGKKLANRRFKAPDVTCQGMYVSKRGKEIYRPDDETIASWLKAGMAGGWR